LEIRNKLVCARLRNLDNPLTTEQLETQRKNIVYSVKQKYGQVKKYKRKREAMMSRHRRGILNDSQKGTWEVTKILPAASLANGASLVFNDSRKKQAWEANQSKIKDLLHNFFQSFVGKTLVSPLCALPSSTCTERPQKSFWTAAAK
jgi:hypothetical protein